MLKSGKIWKWGGGDKRMDGVLWFSIFIICLIAEALTYALVSIWFAGGALLAFIAAAAGAGIKTQAVLFCIGSAMMLAGLRPAAKRLSGFGNGKARLHPNADRVIGKTAVVKRPIGKSDESFDGVGSVICCGMEWAARTEDETEILTPYTPVKVLRIEGVKLIVERKLYKEQALEGEKEAANDALAG